MNAREALEAVAVALQAGRFVEVGDKAAVLTRALQDTGAPAPERFKAFVAVRTMALGSPKPGPLAETLQPLSVTELALLCSLAAKSESLS